MEAASAVDQQVHQPMMQTVEKMQHHQACIAAERTYPAGMLTGNAAATTTPDERSETVYIPANLEVQRCEEFLQSQPLNVPYYVAPTYQTYVPPGGSLITHMPPQIKRMKKRTCCC